MPDAEGTDEAGAPAATPSPTPTETRHCNKCGLSGEAPVGGLPSGWSFAVEGRRTVYQCPSCVRVNIRAIEGKLPEEYWEF